MTIQGRRLCVRAWLATFNTERLVKVAGTWSPQVSALEPGSLVDADLVQQRLTTCG